MPADTDCVENDLEIQNGMLEVELRNSGPNRCCLDASQTNLSKFGGTCWEDVADIPSVGVSQFLSFA